MRRRRVRRIMKTYAADDRKGRSLKKSIALMSTKCFRIFEFLVSNVIRGIYGESDATESLGNLSNEAK